jgi:hypothetical protein
MVDRVRTTWGRTRRCYGYTLLIPLGLLLIAVTLGLWSSGADWADLADWIVIVTLALSVSVVTSVLGIGLLLFRHVSRDDPMMILFLIISLLTSAGLLWYAEHP